VCFSFSFVIRATYPAQLILLILINIIIIIIIIIIMIIIIGTHHEAPHVTTDLTTLQFSMALPLVCSYVRYVTSTVGMGLVYFLMAHLLL